MSEMLLAGSSMAECEGSYLWLHLKELSQMMAKFEQQAGTDYTLLFGEAQTGKKREMLFRQGVANEDFYFLYKGLVRSYEIVEGEDLTHNFFFACQFVDTYATMSLHEKATFNISFLENSVYYRINRKTLEALEHKYSVLREIRILVLSSQGKWQSMKDKLQAKQSHRQRIQHLMQQHPHYIQRIPQKYLATYLGMHETTFSYLRKELSQQ